MRRALLIEDNQAVLRLLTDALRPEGFVCEAAVADEALRLARLGKFDIILLDLVLPYLDGTAILGYLRARPETRHIPVVIISGVPNVAGPASAMGAFATVPKPFELDHLLDTIHRALGDR